MNLLDRVSSIFCFFLGLAVFAGGLRLGLKVHLDMGPGFFPLVSGGILSLLSIVLFMQSLIKKGTKEQEGSFWADPRGWRWVLLTLLAMVAYPLILSHLGFLLSTFLLLLFLFLVIARQSWWVAGIEGMITSVAVYVIFEIWLKANFPRGILGF